VPQCTVQGVTLGILILQKGIYKKKIKEENLHKKKIKGDITKIAHIAWVKAY
jgi:hypothetical protein